VYKIAYSTSLRYLVITVAALLVAGCIHIPVQPQLSHSSASVSKQQSTHCIPEISLSRESETAKSGLSPERISVLSWNMYKQSHDNWATDFHRLSHKQDLLILQEAYMDERLTSVLSDSPYNWVMTSAFFYRDIANGVVTASRNKSNKHCALYAKEPLIQTPKSILISTYPIVGSNQYLLVANVHGINFTLGLESYRQQFKALRKVLQNHQGPLILAGDFNSWRNDRQTILDKLSQNLSLQRVGYESHRRMTVFGNPIDHVYYRGLEIVQTSSPSVTSSDHNPLLVTFKMAERQHKRYAKTP
jgi:endonuclease/exonuclease/phosphatase (EEP) superfamily protein YafD